jgi:hypothetical protein
MVFVPHRKHIFGPLRLVTGIALLCNISVRKYCKRLDEDGYGGQGETPCGKLGITTAFYEEMGSDFTV